MCNSENFCIYGETKKVICSFISQYTLLNQSSEYLSDSFISLFYMLVVVDLFCL